jgi:hypothetical protein
MWADSADHNVQTNGYVYVTALILTLDVIHTYLLSRFAEQRSKRTISQTCIMKCLIVKSLKEQPQWPRSLRCMLRRLL